MTDESDSSLLAALYWCPCKAEAVAIEDRYAALCDRPRHFACTRARWPRTSVKFGGSAIRPRNPSACSS
jgi:hypothetical protein